MEKFYLIGGIGEFNSCYEKFCIINMIIFKYSSFNIILNLYLIIQDYSLST